MKADYFNPVKLKIGRGSLRDIFSLLGGRTALLVTTTGALKRGLGRRIEELCGGLVVHITDRTVSNPTISSIEECYEEIRGYDFEVIIGLGGGSVLDTAKVVAYLSGLNLEQGWLGYYFREKVAKACGGAPRPVLAIPTTAGTGSEVTSWATVWDEKLKKKYSLSDDLLYPEWALLDPSLTESLPYEVTLSGSLDALSHSMEAVWNRNANPVSTELALRSVEMIMAVWNDNFRERYADRESREKLQLASLLAGLAFSNTKTALAHSISYPLTSLLGIPHGLACGFTLPEILLHNGEAAEEIVSPLALAMGCSSVYEARECLYEVFKRIGVPEFLEGFVKSPDILDGIQAEYISPGRADNNIVDVQQAEAEQIVASAFRELTGD